MSRNNGKESEKYYLAQLKSIMDSTPKFIVGRFPDTHDARNFLPAQPSDYYITFSGTPWLVEVKSSIDPKRFPLKNISSKQIGFAMRYLKSGWKSMFVITRVTTNEWFYLPFEVVINQFMSKHASFTWEELVQYKHELNFNFWEIQ